MFRCICNCVFTLKMAVDLMNLLCLDPKHSTSPFGGQFRQILLSKDHTNTGDFVFHYLLQHFGRREPNSSVLLVTLSHDWSNYSIASTKCGFSIRQTENGGNIVVVDIIQRFLQDTILGLEVNYCEYIVEQFRLFMEKCAEQNGTAPAKPVTVMIDDLGILLSLHHRATDIYHMISTISGRLRDLSTHLKSNHLNHVILQTSSDLGGTLANIINSSDVLLTLRPLETGHSTRVDGTIMISDNRLPRENKQMQLATPLMATKTVGMKKTYFYKLSDRRVRLTNSVVM